MEETTAYLSFAGCALCARIPPKAAEDIGEGPLKIIPPEVDALQLVIEMEDEGAHRYCSSTTKVLKCPQCGTYYYYNHYDDEGEYFMDPPSDTLTLRRYTPLAAMHFLGRIAASAENALPNTLGQLASAFTGGGCAPDTLISSQGLEEKMRAARVELEALKSRYDEIIHDLIEVIQHGSAGWAVQLYAIETLCGHFLSQADWASLSRLLLHHSEPAVRVLTAKLVMGAATGDAPVIDLIHMDRGLRAKMEAVLAKKAQMQELLAVLLELSQAEHGVVYEYDHGYGNSSYSQRSVRSIALYYLVVAAGRRPSLLASAVPTLLGLLSTDERLNYEVCWVLRTLAGKKKYAQTVYAGIEALDSAKKAMLHKDKEFLKLVEACKKRL